MTRKINLIVLHCSSTRSNQRFTVEMLKACHNARFNGKGIGYHYFIEKDGKVFQTRDENEIGMHARHYNAHSIGICYEGGLDEKGRPAHRPTPLPEDRLPRCRDHGPLRTRRRPQSLPLVLLPRISRLLREH